MTVRHVQLLSHQFRLSVICDIRVTLIDVEFQFSSDRPILHHRIAWQKNREDRPETLLPMMALNFALRVTIRPEKATKISKNFDEIIFVIYLTD